jgi:hypothetical protein
MMPAPTPGAASPSAMPTAPAPPADGQAAAAIETRLMVQGSTGGAGLRGLEGEEATPIQMSVLYFDETQDLKAYDDIELAGTGQSQVTLERKVIGQDPEPTTNPSVVSGVTPGMNPSRQGP